MFGPLDKMVGDEKLKQTVINEGDRKKWRDLTRHYLSMWCYARAIPFNALDDQEFDLFCEAVGKHGPDYKGQSQYRLRVSLLRKAYDLVNSDLSKQRAA